MCLHWRADLRHNALLEDLALDEIEQLTEAAAGGDRGAIDALIERYLPELRAFVRLRVGQALRAHESKSDVVQSVCRDVLQNVDNFRFPGESAFRTWLFTTALRKIGKRSRHHTAQKRDVRKNEPLESSSDARLANYYRSFSSPSGHAIAKEEMARVEAAFDELSEEQREVVTLAHLVGMSRAEIAAQTGRSEGAVRVLLHRALVKLSGLLGS